ncbi:hypothetical protein BFJ68_g18504 [Fusarium oxysporum]|uniref:Uncharacterized protein n=1 Tax=Fusarium oxysporum TaxID=5507 RepID=A0A420MK63_FUSOX|nr:hypothetical protein BFJ68_g18504 [Fusarium oxysporum]
MVVNFLASDWSGRRPAIFDNPVTSPRRTFSPRLQEHGFIHGVPSHSQLESLLLVRRSYVTRHDLGAARTFNAELARKPVDEV